MGKLDELYDLLEKLRTDENEREIEEIKKYVETGDTRKSFNKT